VTHSYEFPRAAVTADCVVFGVSLPKPSICRLHILLVRRADEPFKDQWALPGGHLRISEDDDLEATARRELEEETGVKIAHLEQLYTFSGRSRDPRGRVITVAHLALVRSDQVSPNAGGDAAEARWWSLFELPELAFDHDDILSKGMQRLRAKVTYETIGFELLPEQFSLAELQALYEIILGRGFDKRNFRRQMLKTGVLKPSGFGESYHGNNPTLYTLDREKAAVLDKLGQPFELSLARKNRFV